MLSLQCAWGVSSTTHGRVVPGRPHEVEVGLGSTIVRWCARSQQQRIVRHAAHDDLIVLFKEAPSATHIVTVSHSGTVNCWSPEWELHDTIFLAHASNVTNGAWDTSSTRLALVSQGPDPVLIVLAAALGASMAEIWRLPLGANSALVQWASTSTLMLAESPPDKPVRLRLVDAATNALRREVSHRTDCITAMSPTSPTGSVALGLASGHVWVLDAATLAQLAVLSGLRVPKALGWFAGELLVVLRNGNVVQCGGENFAVHTRHARPVGLNDVDHAEFDAERGFVWLISRSGLHCHELAPPGDLAAGLSPLLAPHQLTCCGVAFSADGSLIFSGDFVGNMCLWEEPGKSLVPRARARLPDGEGVRCVIWMNDAWWIGGMQGGLFRANATFGTLELVITVPGSVLTLQAPPAGNPFCHLAVGTSNGDVFLIHGESVKHHFRAHHPVTDQPQNILFGSLHRRAEIWSLVFSPDGRHVVTGSEDQTARVWRVPACTLRARLTGHTLAVTCVDWQPMTTPDTTVLCTCSDDRTVRVYDGETFHLRFTVASTLHGWHTLTYMRACPALNRVVVATQHGHVMLWALDTGDNLLFKKVHKGSIEGLVVYDATSRLCTVSADNTVQLFSLG